MQSLFVRSNNVTTYEGPYKIEKFETEDAENVTMWSRTGVTTREDGPAVTITTGTYSLDLWVCDGLMHRETDPALILHADTMHVEKWYTRGQSRNGTGGPNQRQSHGGSSRMEWLDNEKRPHRDDGPAIVCTFDNGSKNEWFIHGERRTDGPYCEEFTDGVLTSKSFVNPVDGFKKFEYYPDGSIKAKYANDNIAYGFMEHFPENNTDPNQVTLIKYHPNGSIKQRNTAAENCTYTADGLKIYESILAGQCRKVTEWDIHGRISREEWYVNGKHHREPTDGPALTIWTRTKVQKWFVNGKLHAIETMALPESEWRESAPKEDSRFIRVGNLIGDDEETIQDFLTEARGEAARLKAHCEAQQAEIIALRAEIEELQLRPGGLGYHAAREHFEHTAYDHFEEVVHQKN